MMKLTLSSAASALLRALLARSGVDRSRLHLVEFRSTDWHSLTFAGERHRIELRIPGPDAQPVLARLTEQIEEADWPIPGYFVADIAARPATAQPDGSLLLAIDALTIAD